jgi:hypothetical protein
MFDAWATALRNATTSSYRDVSVKFVRSGVVLSDDRTAAFRT